MFYGQVLLHLILILRQSNFIWIYNLHGRNKSPPAKSFVNEFKRDWLPLPEHSTVPYLLLEARVGWNDDCRGFRSWRNCGRTSDRNFIASNFSIIFWIHVTIRENNLHKALGPSRALWPWPPISSLLRTWAFWGFGDFIMGFSRKIWGEKSIAGYQNSNIGYLRAL